MKISKINYLKKKAIKEAQKEVDVIFKKYSKLIVEEISNQIPKGQKLIIGNGLCLLEDEKGVELAYGNSWSRTAKSNPKMEVLSDLQYCEDIHGDFNIPNIIDGKLLKGF